MLLSFTVVHLLILLVYPRDSVSQTAGDDGGGFNLPGDMDPGDGPIGPVGNVDAEYKFDDGFYQKIQAWPIPAGFLPSDGFDTHDTIPLTDDTTSTIDFALHPVEEISN